MRDDIPDLCSITLKWQEHNASREERILIQLVR